MYRSEELAHSRQLGDQTGLAKLGGGNQANQWKVWKMTLTIQPRAADRQTTNKKERGKTERNTGTGDTQSVKPNNRELNDP